jgi:O-acetyl-ADP-ribose deacetylase (regulator of RNase III)
MSEIELFLGDITGLELDAIVNAANNHLRMGGGVAGAIKRRGGAEIEKEAVALGPIEVGESVATGAGQLPARWVVHAAVMALDLKTDEEKIRKATRSALKKCAEIGARSVAFPALGTGVGGFPMAKAARIMLQEFRAHLESGRQPGRIVVALIDRKAYGAFQQALAAA